MGKNIIYTYSCDSCNIDFSSPDDVLCIENITNGVGDVIFDNLGQMLCKNCLVNIITKNKTDVICTTTSEIINTTSCEYKVLHKIDNDQDEAAFIEFLGHLSKENFIKIYNKSLITCYYPTEEEPTSSDLSNCYQTEIKVIYKALAGTPQIKTIKSFVNNILKTAYISKELFESLDNGC